MSTLLRSMCLAALCAVLPSLSGSAVAVPTSGGLTSLSSSATSGSSLIEEVQVGRRGGPRAGLRGSRRVGIRNGRRYGNYRGNRSRGNYGRNAGIGIGAAIVGGAILSEAARAARRDGGSAWDRCAATYRSFERSTGMYTGYDGIRRRCPYLG